MRIELCKIIRLKTAVALSAVLLAGCATGGRKRIVQRAVIHRAPDNPPVVEIVKSVTGVATQTLQLATAIVNPIASGLGAGIAGLLTGVGQASGMIPLVDTVEVMVTVDGFDGAKIGKAHVEAGDLTAESEGVEPDGEGVRCNESWASPRPNRPAGDFEVDIGGETVIE